MSSTLQHRGVVTRVEARTVVVSVVAQSACAGCHAKGICGESGAERVIVVKTSNASEYSVGESVVVALQRQSMALVSVVWGYVVPLVVLLAVLFGSVSLGLSDGIAALSTILAVVIYYVGLYVARRVFERKIEFTIFKE